MDRALPHHVGVGVTRVQIGTIGKQGAIEQDPAVLVLGGDETRRTVLGKTVFSTVADVYEARYALISRRYADTGLLIETADGSLVRARDATLNRDPKEALVYLARQIDGR